LELSVHMVT